jgi:hypothetical protein
MLRTVCWRMSLLLYDDLCASSCKMLSTDIHTFWRYHTMSAWYGRMSCMMLPEYMYEGVRLSCRSTKGGRSSAERDLRNVTNVSERLKTRQAVSSEGSHSHHKRLVQAFYNLDL